MIDLASLSEAVFLEDPVDLLLFTPHEVPILPIGFLPLTVVECLEDTVTKRCLEFDVLA